MDIQKTEQLCDHSSMGILGMTSYIQFISHKHELIDLLKIPA
jgi:hypothetical protein